MALIVPAWDVVKTQAEFDRLVTDGFLHAQRFAASLIKKGLIFGGSVDDAPDIVMEAMSWLQRLFTQGTLSHEHFQSAWFHAIRYRCGVWNRAAYKNGVRDEQKTWFDTKFVLEVIGPTDTCAFEEDADIDFASVYWCETSRGSTRGDEVKALCRAISEDSPQAFKHRCKHCKSGFDAKPRRGLCPACFSAARRYRAEQGDWPSHAIKQSRIVALPITITIGNETKTIEQWAADPRCKVCAGTLYDRLQRGFPRDIILRRIEHHKVPRNLSPKGRPSVMVKGFGECKSIKDWCADSRCHVPTQTVYWRVRNGWSIEDAISPRTQKPGNSCKTTS